MTGHLNEIAQGETQLTRQLSKVSSEEGRGRRGHVMNNRNSTERERAKARAQREREHGPEQR